MDKFKDELMNKVTWRDLHDATQQELKKTYKLSSRGLERAVRAHLDGANATERRNLYEVVFGRGKRR